MKKISLYLAGIAIATLGLLPSSAFAQNEKAEKKAWRGAKKEKEDNYWTTFRQYDQSGVNVFEPTKQATAPFDGVKVRFGTGFTQQRQKLEHENARSLGTSNTNPKLHLRLTSGFSIAQANQYFDALLAEGIQMNVTTYLPSHHHYDGRSSLLAGDRTGSIYSFQMEPTGATSTAIAFFGRLNGSNFFEQIQSCS